MKKLTEKAEVYDILRADGKSIQDAYKLAGYQGKAGGTAPYQLEKRIKAFSLDHPELLKIGHNVAS